MPRAIAHLLSLTLPIVAVLLLLPIQQELEFARLGERAALEDRVAVLSKHPDFVVHAASGIRMIWRSGTGRGSSGGGTGEKDYKGDGHCTRLVSATATRANGTVKLLSTLNRPKINIVRIVGERNSGVQTLRYDLARAFRNVTVESGVTRWVYWFQTDTLLTRDEIATANETLVIHLALDPYDWMARMNANPIHAPYHRPILGTIHDTTPYNSSKLDALYTRPWTLPRPDWDDLHPVLGHCQYRFPYGAVVPCSPGKNSGNRASKLYPVYEMDPYTHRPYPTVAAFRAAKLTNHLNVSSWMPHTIHVRSQDVASLRGVNLLVADLIRRYRLGGACEVTKRDRKAALLSLSALQSPSTSSWASLPATSQLHGAWAEEAPPPLTREQENWITCNFDWYVENELGYQPRKDPNVICPHGNKIGKGGPFDDSSTSSKGNAAGGVGHKRFKKGFFYKYILGGGNSNGGGEHGGR